MKRKIFCVVCVFVIATFVNAESGGCRVDVLSLFSFEHGSSWSIYRDDRQAESFYLLRDVDVEPWLGHNPMVGKIIIRLEEDSSTAEHIEWLKMDLLIEESRKTEVDGYPATFVQALETSLHEPLLVYIIELDEGKLLTLSAWTTYPLRKVVSREFVELVNSVRFND